MVIGCGYNRFSERDRIGQGAGRDLLQVKIGRDVDVGGGNQIQQILFVEEFVDPTHMRANT